MGVFWMTGSPKAVQEAKLRLSELIWLSKKWCGVEGLHPKSFKFIYLLIHVCISFIYLIFYWIYWCDVIWVSVCNSLRHHLYCMFIILCCVFTTQSQVSFQHHLSPLYPWSPYCCPCLFIRIRAVFGVFILTYSVQRLRRENLAWWLVDICSCPKCAWTCLVHTKRWLEFGPIRKGSWAYLVQAKWSLVFAPVKNIHA